MKKNKAILILGILAALSFVFQPFTGVTYARQLSAADYETVGGSASPDNSAAQTPASRSGSSLTNQQFVSYSVKPGDTLSKLAADFQTDIDSLIAMNSITNPHVLQVGQSLTIPKALKQQEIPAVMSIDKIMDFTLTAYTAGPESTGKFPGQAGYGVTSTGKTATEGRTIAVDPRIIPYGTKVYIEGVGIRTAEDTGGAIKGNRIDVYMEGLSQAVQFGVKKNVRVYVLSSPNA